MERRYYIGGVLRNNLVRLPGTYYWETEREVSESF
jgi:hypothetical protein